MKRVIISLVTARPEIERLLLPGAEFDRLKPKLGRRCHSNVVYDAPNSSQNLFEQPEFDRAEPWMTHDLNELSKFQPCPK